MVLRTEYTGLGIFRSLHAPARIERRAEAIRTTAVRMRPGTRGRPRRREEEAVLIDVVPVVRQLVPGLLRHSKPSVACVLTTHQKYLVFDADASHPACVVEIGDEKRLRRIDRILTSLHARCPREVPQSLACASWGPGTVVHIQEGLPGLPWFRLFDT